MPLVAGKKFIHNSFLMNLKHNLIKLNEIRHLPPHMLFITFLMLNFG